MNPPSALHGAMSRDRKPFTYTPGGLDLSEIKSERMAKRLMRNAMNQGVPEVPIKQVQSPSATSNPIMVPNFNCLPVQVFPTMNLPANPKSLLRTRSHPDPKEAPIQRVPPPQPNQYSRPSRIENTEPLYSPTTNNNANYQRPFSMYEYNPVSNNAHTLPRTSYGSSDPPPFLPEMSYEAEYLQAPPRNVISKPTAPEFKYDSKSISETSGFVDLETKHRNVDESTHLFQAPTRNNGFHAVIAQLECKHDNKPQSGHSEVIDIETKQPKEIENYTIPNLDISLKSEIIELDINQYKGLSDSVKIPDLDISLKTEIVGKDIAKKDTIKEMIEIPIIENFEYNQSIDNGVLLESNNTAENESELDLEFSIQPLSVTSIPSPFEKPVEEESRSDDEQREVKVVKKQVKKESKSEVQNGDQNGDQEAELTVKLPTKKSAAKTETKVEVVKKQLPDGSIEEVKTTTTKTTVDGKTTISTKTETTIIPKDDEEEEEIEEEEEEEQEENGEVVEVEENGDDEVVEEVIVKKSPVVENGHKVVTKEEHTETTVTKKVAVVQNQEPEQEEEEEEVEEEVVETKAEPAKKEPKVEVEEENEVEEEVEEEEVVKTVEAKKEEEEEEVEEEQEEEVVVEVKVEKQDASEEPAKEKEEVEEEYEEAKEKVEEEKVEKPEPSKVEKDEESEYTEEEYESDKEEAPKPAPQVEKQEPEKQDAKIDEPKKEVKKEPKEEKDVKPEPQAELKPEPVLPLREPSIPLEKVEDVEIKPIGATSETVTKSHTQNTEIITSNDKPSGQLTTQTEYNRIENIVTVNRTTKTLDHSYEQLTQHGVPTVKTYFAPPNIDRISTSPLPARPYQPVYPPAAPVVDQPQERRHSLLLERLSMERQMPSDIYQNNYQYNNQTFEQTRQYSQEPQAEVLTVSNVKPSTITNSQWYQQQQQQQQVKKENVIYNNVSTPASAVTPAPAPPASQPWTQPQPSPQLPPQPQYQPTYTENTPQATYQQSAYQPYTPKPATWGPTSDSLSSSYNNQQNQYSLNQNTTESYQKSTQQYSSSYVPPPWEQDSSYVADVSSQAQNFYQPPPATSTFTPGTSQGWKPTPPKNKFSKPPPTAYIPPAPNQSFVKPVNPEEPPRVPGKKTYYSEYERRYITVPESTYIPGETKYQPQPDPSPQYYYDHQEPQETVEPQWRKELREFTEKTSTQTTEQSSVKPPWEEDPKYAKPPSTTIMYSATPTWSQTLRPRSWRERSFESEYVGSQEFSKTSTLGRGRPLSSYGKNSVETIPERPRGVSVDRYNPNSYQAPAEHLPVQTHTLTVVPPAASYHNPNVPAYHAQSRASAEPREQTIYPQARNWGDSRASPLQSRSFKYLQWITGTDD